MNRAGLAAALLCLVFGLLVSQPALAAPSPVLPTPPPRTTPAPPLPASSTAIISASLSNPSAVVGQDVEVDIDIVTENMEIAGPGSGSFTAHVGSGSARVVSATADSGSCTTGVLCTFASVPGDWHVHVAVVVQPLTAGPLDVDLAAQFQGSHVFGASAQKSVTITATNPAADIDAQLTTKAAKPAVGKTTSATLWIVNAAGDSPTEAVAFLKSSPGLRITGFTAVQGATCDQATRSCTSTGALAQHGGAKVVVSLLCVKSGRQTLTATAGIRGDATDPNGANNTAKLVFAVHGKP